jgi:hypothetical protein
MHAYKQGQGKPKWKIPRGFKAKTQVLVERKGKKGYKIIKRMLFTKQGNNLKCLVMPLLNSHTTL